MLEKTLEKYFYKEIRKLNLEHLELEYRFNSKVNWCYGCFSEYENTIEFTNPLLGLPKEQVILTILHELAHAIDWHRNGKQWRTHPSGRCKLHDKVWREICVEIGYPKDLVSSF